MDWRMERPSYTVGCTSLSTSRFQRFRRVVFSSTNNKRQKQIYCQDFCFESNFLFTYHQSPTPHYLPLLSLSLSLSLSFSLSLFLSFSLSLFLSLLFLRLSDDVIFSYLFILLAPFYQRHKAKTNYALILRITSRLNNFTNHTRAHFLHRQNGPFQRPQISARL